MAHAAQHERPRGLTLGTPRPRGGVSVRERVRRPGCVPPHNRRILTSRLHNLVLGGCRRPRAAPLAFGVPRNLTVSPKAAVASVASAVSLVDAERQPDVPGQGLPVSLLPPRLDY
jgi:hypothetical protein